jgi:hypothetical protein
MMTFKPTGTLDLSSSSTEVKGNFTRSKNLKYEQNAIAITRHGSKRTTENQLAKKARFLIEQGGNRYSFASTFAYQNEASLSFSNMIANALADAQWDGMKYNSFNDTTERVFCLNGTDRVKISGTTMEEWGIDAPTNAPVLGVGAGTGLTGTYNVKYTYLRKSGSTIIVESNPSDAASSGQALTNQDLDVTWTASSDPQVTHVRLYRTVPSGLVYFVDQDIAVGTVTVDTSTADTSLGTSVVTTNDRPPLGTLVTSPLYNGIVFIAKGNLLHYSKTKQPEYFPLLNFIEVGSPSFPIKTLLTFNGALFALTTEQIWSIQGTTQGSFQAVPMQSLTGSPNQYGAVGVKGKGIYHIGEDGIYLYTGVDQKLTEQSYEPIFPDAGGQDGVNTNGVQGVPTASSTKWLIQFQNKIYFHYGNGNVIVFNTDSGRSYYHKYDLELNSPAIDYTNDRFICGDTGKYIRTIEDPTATLDIASSIAWEIQSEDYTEQTSRDFPKWMKYDVDVTNATSVTGSLIVDDVVHKAHTLTESRKPKRRLVDVTNGLRFAVRMNGTGLVKIYAATIE